MKLLFLHQTTEVKFIDAFICFESSKLKVTSRSDCFFNLFHFQEIQVTYEKRRNNNMDIEQQLQWNCILKSYKSCLTEESDLYFIRVLHFSYLED